VLAAYNVAYKLSYINGSLNIANNLWNPSWLLFGPSLYFAVRNSKDSLLHTKQLFLHAIAFMVFLVYYLILRFSPNSNTYFLQSYEVLFSIVPISLASYVVILYPTLKQEALTKEGCIDLFFLVIAFFVGLIFITALMLLCKYIIVIETGIDYYNYINYLLVGLFIFILTFLIATPNTHFISEQLTRSAYSKSSLKEEQVKIYINRIEEHFKAPESFRRYDISLDSLSRDLNIPKRHLTQVFNVHLKKSFYRYVAAVRIDYAIGLMQGSALTIEALAHECGFSSKTSFNNYFKAATGLSPMAYLNNKLDA
jgi:AraC-like DNA-binding protein